MTMKFSRHMFSIMKPGIASASALASLAGMSIADRGLPSARLIVLTLSCIIAAACGSGLLNVLLERETDALMPRVASRGRALDALGVRTAWVLAALLTASSFMASWLFINPAASLIIASAVLLYVVFYTLCLKKNSPFGTVLGAVPGALPVLAGYAAVDPKIGPGGWILFAVLLVWQQPHFLALALEYREEYASAGFPVMPVRMGEEYTRASLLMYASAMLPLTLSLAWLGFCTAMFGIAAFAAGTLFLAFTWSSVIKNRGFGRVFTVSIIYLAALLLAIVLDQKFGLENRNLTGPLFLLN